VQSTASGVSGRVRVASALPVRNQPDHRLDVMIRCGGHGVDPSDRLPITPHGRCRPGRATLGANWTLHDSAHGRYRMARDPHCRWPMCSGCSGTLILSTTQAVPDADAWRCDRRSAGTTGVATPLARWAQAERTARTGTPTPSGYRPSLERAVRWAELVTALQTDTLTDELAVAADTRRSARYAAALAAIPAPNCGNDMAGD